MKISAVVLFENKNPRQEAGADAVLDALWSGGVFLDEVVYLPIAAPSQVTAAVMRLSTDCGAVLLICPEEGMVTARRAITSACGREFEAESLLETEACLFSVLPSGERGAQLVRTETVPHIDALRRASYFRMVLKAICVPPEKLSVAITLAERAAAGALLLHVREKYGDTRIELVYDRATPKVIADEVVRILGEELKDYLYALEDVSIAERLVEALTVRRRVLSTAESFTGGGVGRAIVRVSGASAVFFEGLNTYNSKSKEERLGVSPITLKAQGAVSDETAYQMATGLLASGNCDIAIATTGIAGPLSDESGAPVGLCYFAVGTKEEVSVYRYRLAGDRETVIETGINLALFLAYKQLKLG